MPNIQRLLNACFERSRACCCNFKGWCQYSCLWLVKGKENSALLSSCCLSAQKSWGSGATISTADSLCLKRSPVNQNSFSDKGKEAQKQNTKRQKQHTIKTQCSQQNPNLYSYCWGGGVETILPNNRNNYTLFEGWTVTAICLLLLFKEVW